MTYDTASEASTRTNPSHRTITTLRDSPAPKDLFGGHQRVADAIGEVLRESGGRTIGLEGVWGSGKSTIVGLVCKNLPAGYKAFVFDAWTHEGDPLRRSFLEALIRFCIREHWVDVLIWRKELDKLALRRRTTKQVTRQALTRVGKWLALSALLVPIGAAVLGYSLGHRHWMVALGLILSLFPAILAILFLLIPRTWVIPAKAHDESHENTDLDDDTFFESDESDESDDPLAILAKAGKTVQRSDTFETPEPTTIEFADKFNVTVQVLGPT